MILTSCHSYCSRNEIPRSLTDSGGFFMCLRVVDDLRFLPCLCSGQCSSVWSHDLRNTGLSRYLNRRRRIPVRLSSYWNKNHRVGCPFMPRLESGSVDSRDSDSLLTWRLNAGGWFIYRIFISHAVSSWCSLPVSVLSWVLFITSASDITSVRGFFFAWRADGFRISHMTVFGDWTFRMFCYGEVEALFEITLFTVCPYFESSHISQIVILRAFAMTQWPRGGFRNAVGLCACSWLLNIWQSEIYVSSL